MVASAIIILQIIIEIIAKCWLYGDRDGSINYIIKIQQISLKRIQAKQQLSGKGNPLGIVVQIKIWQYSQTVCTQTRICTREYNTWNYLGFWDTNRSPNLSQKTRPYYPMVYVWTRIYPREYNLHKILWNFEIQINLQILARRPDHTTQWYMHELESIQENIICIKSSGILRYN